MTLEELHGVVRDVWLTRHDGELEEEKAARRKGRSKSAKEFKLDEEKLREMEEYRTGMGNAGIFVLLRIATDFLSIQIRGH